jgi:hypothetical protein
VMVLRELWQWVMHISFQAVGVRRLREACRVARSTAGHGCLMSEGGEARSAVYWLQAAAAFVYAS